MRLLNLLLTSCLIAVTFAFELRGRIIPNILIEDVSTLDSSTTRVVLNGAQYTTHISSNGQFIFPNVEPGSYLLEVQSIQYIFPKIRVDISKDNKVQSAYTALNIDWNNKGYSIEYPLEIQAKAEAEYFTVKKGFSVLGLFKNPMMIMIGFSGLMLVFMPKLMKQLEELDPEASKELNQSQLDAQKMLADIPGLSQMFGK